jgi:ankyrin repeat protein
MPRSPRYFGTETRKHKTKSLSHPLYDYNVYPPKKLSADELSEGDLFDSPDSESEASKNEVSENDVSELHDAIKKNQLNKVTCICVSLNSTSPIKTWKLINKEYKGYTALQLAALYGLIDIVEYLLSQRASLVTQNAAGMDALMCALAIPYNPPVESTRENKNSILKLFLERNPQFANVDNSGKNVLFYAVKADDCEAFEMLLQLPPEKLKAMLSLRVQGKNLESFIIENGKKDILAIFKSKLSGDDASDAELSIDDELDPPTDDESDLADNGFKLPSSCVMKM